MRQVTIGQNQFTIMPLKAMASWRLQARIAPALSSIVEAIAPAIVAGKDIGDLEVIGAILPLVSGFFEKLPAPEFELVTRELLSTTAVNNMMLFAPPGSGEADRFDTVMQGHILDVWRLVSYAILENYPDFFTALGGTNGAAKMASPSEALTT